jgi:hypothetical protein
MELNDKGKNIMLFILSVYFLQFENRTNKAFVTKLRQSVSISYEDTASNRLEMVLPKRLQIPSRLAKSKDTMNAVFICSLSHINSMNSSQTWLTYISCLTL